MPTRVNQAVWYDKYNRWQIKVQLDGVRKTFTSSTAGPAGKRECHRKADEWLKYRLIGENTHVDVLFDRWVENLKINTSQGHWGQYESIGRAWVKPAFGHKRIGRVTEQDLKDVITQANRQGKSKKYITNIRNCMMAFLLYCRGMKSTTLHPEKLPIPRSAPAPEKNIIQPSSLKTLFTSTETTFRGQPDPDWFIYAYRFMVATGLRPGELIGLERTSIRDGKLFVKGAINAFGTHTRGKNENALRTFVMPAIAAQAWTEQQAQLRRAGLVSRYAFPDKDGGPVNLKTFEKYWTRYRLHNGIDKTTPYELRHTFISVNKNMPDALKKMLVGHSTDMDTDGVYSHEMDGDMQRAAEMVDAAFRKFLE